MDGLLLGLSLGADERTEDGILLGSSLGTNDGDDDGFSECPADGSLDGVVDVSGLARTLAPVNSKVFPTFLFNVSITKSSSVIFFNKSDED